MADPRFYDNAGPFELAEVCARIGAQTPEGVRQSLRVYDVAALDCAGPGQLAFVADARRAAKLLGATAAEFCLAPRDGFDPPERGPVLLRVGNPVLAFAAASALFYPRHGSTGIDHADERWIDPLAVIAPDAVIAEGAVIGPGAEIGSKALVGPQAVIGRGVTVGAGSRIGAHVSVTHTLLGDNVIIHPGARIGQDGFGFVPSAKGHRKIPQLGRVIVQDDVEIGANVTIDRGALGDTVIGQGTKIDNLVQIGHNCRIGRHCIIVAQVGLSGSTVLEDFAILGGQVGVADHVRIGKGARIAAQSGVTGVIPAGETWAGYPARPAMQWKREAAALARLAKRKGRTDE